MYRIWVSEDEIGLSFHRECLIKFKTCTCAKMLLKMKVLNIILDSKTSKHAKVVTSIGGDRWRNEYVIIQYNHYFSSTSWIFGLLENYPEWFQRQWYDANSLSGCLGNVKDHVETCHAILLVYMRNWQDECLWKLLVHFENRVIRLSAMAARWSFEP